MLIELPALPPPELDLSQDPEGYSAELSVERELELREVEAFSNACLRLPPVASFTGSNEIRGLASVDDETLWVYVHEVGPGVYGPEEESAATELLERLWRAIHEAAAAE